jgi:hypothetical protein
MTVAGVAAGALTTLVIAGCGAGSARPTGVRLSVGAAARDPHFVACMRRYGLTVRRNGDLRLSKAVGPAQLDGAERACGFDSMTHGIAQQPAAEARAERRFATSVEHTRAYREAVAALARCLRSHGASVPGPPRGKKHGGVGEDARHSRAVAAARSCRAEILHWPAHG